MAKVSVLSWRSGRLRRVVSSALAVEALSQTQGVAELEWMQTLFRDEQFADVTAPGWESGREPCSIALNRTSEIANRHPSLAVVDAKERF